MTSLFTPADRPRAARDPVDLLWAVCVVIVLGWRAAWQPTAGNLPPGDQFTAASR